MTLTEAKNIVADNAEWDGRGKCSVIHDGKRYSGISEAQTAINLYTEQEDEDEELPSPPDEIYVPELDEGSAWSDGKASSAACMGDGEGEAEEDRGGQKKTLSGGESRFGGEGVAGKSASFKPAVKDAIHDGEYGNDKTDVHERANFSPNMPQNDYTSVAESCLPPSVLKKLEENRIRRKLHEHREQ